MRIFHCSACGNTVFFENVQCTRCGHELGFLPDLDRTDALVPAGQDNGSIPLYRAFAAPSGAEDVTYRRCDNGVRYAACNWMVRAGDTGALCAACRLNEVVPDLSNPKLLEGWRALEQAKRRMLFGLRELGLPLESRRERPEDGLLFSFLADAPDGSERVFTGHHDGHIVINVAEADDPFREKLRKQLGETYRTLLGHFRHEIGHYYWDRLIRDSRHLEPFRSLFGDETLDYRAALQRHYDQGPPADWALRYISSYATMHPSEDWAETWAHYLHMFATLATADSCGLALRPVTEAVTPSGAELQTPEVDRTDFDQLIDVWVQVSLAINSLNRSMGLADAYPFVLSTAVIDKLRFVHRLMPINSAPAQ